MTNVNDSTMKSAVAAVRRRHVDAINHADIEAAAGIFGAEGTFLPPGAPALSGIPAIRSWFAKAFEAVRFEDFGLSPGVVEEVGDLVIEHGSWRATVVPRDRSEGGPTGGTYLTVYKRRADGEVVVVRDCFNGLAA
jgi:ketosteroid isomerase-like protein